QGTYLGMIPAGWTMDVTESYHMVSSTTNWAQGDVMNFDITITAEQLKGTVVLEDKNQVAPWMVLAGNDINGTLTYGVKDAAFNFSFAGKAPLASTGYSLIVYKEAWSSPSDSAWPRSVIVLASATSDGSGNVTIPQTSIDFGYNLLNSKVWLVKTADLTGNTLSTYTPNAYLFETGLMDYYDSSN
ncbi:MAG: hypothetical protein NTV62_01385, partial [Candidatus Gribaldobacteria bacterium]|nr:hypothetical protein [Candidatus Gribaldobacteria bacterium]